MLTVNIREAKTHLSKLIAGAVRGETFIIAKAGKPLVTVTPIAPVSAAQPRIGFMRGRISIPEMFDDLGREEIEDMFRG